MTKVKSTMNLKVKPIVDDGEAPAHPEPAPKEENQVTPVAPSPQSLTPVQTDHELKERISEVIETLSQFENLKLPVIRLTEEGFIFREGESAVREFTGILVATKRSNVYYDKKYKAGENLPPRCASSDGVTPNTPNPMALKCSECALNQFGKDGEAKPCKNTRPLFILVDNPDSESLSLIPKVLRVAPTSLTLAQKYAVDIASDFGALYSVRTKFSLFKKDRDQKYYNLKFSIAGKVTPQEKSNAKVILDQWKGYIQDGSFGLDEIEIAEHDAPTIVQDETIGEVDF